MPTDDHLPQGVAANANTLTWLKAVIAAAIVLPVIAFAGIAFYTHAQAVTAAKLQIDRSARVAVEHAQKVLETNNAMFSRILDLLGDDAPAMLPAREEELHGVLTGMAANMTQLQGIWLTDETGRLFASNRMPTVPRTMDLTDREFFQHHRVHPGPEPLISPVLAGRATGAMFFNMSVRRSHRNGSFGGVISTAMSPAYFQNFYRELAGDNANINIELVRNDGAMLAAWPASPADEKTPSGFADNLQSDPGGDVTELTLRDGQGALVAVRNVGSFGIQVRVWKTDAAVLAPWYRELALLGSLLLLAAVGLVSIAWVALQKTRAALNAAADLRDETARRRRAEEVLWQSQKLEALGRLTGGVAHDFNNLLMVVSNSLFLHRRANPANTDGPYVAAIERAVATGSNLTRQLLSFSRRQPLRPEALRLQDRLPPMVELVRTAIGNTVTIVVHIQPDTLPILVDPAEFELALLNLAINAKDAMGNGGTLNIRAGNQVAGAVADGPGEHVIVRVEDNGPGIPAALIGRVFEPFFTTKPAGQGTGLGLSQVYGFCIRAGGMATIESEPGQGTAVLLRLPVAPDESAGTVPQGGSSTVHMEQLLVLLVEDNDEVAEATIAVLTSMGCVVRRSRSGDDALVMLRDDGNAIDCLLTDIVMPGALDGIALAGAARIMRPGLPVLLMSGYSASLSDAEAQLYDVLAKPCEPASLAKAILAALARGKIASTT